MTKKPLWFSSKVDYRKFKCASYASMDDNVNLIKGDFLLLPPWLENAQQVSSSSSWDSFGGPPSRDRGQRQRWRVLITSSWKSWRPPCEPNSQQQEEELLELSASTVVQTGGQGVEEWRPAVVHVLVWGRKRGSGVQLRSPRTKQVKMMPARFID